jgi:hypothetical protein
MDDQTQAIIAGVVRHLLGIAGTAIAAHGIVLTGTQLDTISGAVMVLAAVAWSAWQKTKMQPKGTS